MKKNNPNENCRRLTARKLLGLLVAVLFVLVAGCKTQPDSADMHIQIESPLPDSSVSAKNTTNTPDTSLEIDYYEITGKGPDATEFQISTQSSQTTIPGLPLGDWEVSVIAFSVENVGLGYGDSVITLTSSEQNGTIFVEEFFGTGSADITVTWDESQTINPQFNAYIRPSGSTDPSDLLTPTASSAGTATYQLDDYASGAYLFQAELISDGMLTGGAAEILRITDGQVTTSSLKIQFNDLMVSMQMTLNDNMEKPVSGSITGVPLTAAAGEELMVTFTPDSDSVQTGLWYQWYVNGQYVTDGNPISYIPNEGVQRLDVLVSTSKVGSDGSASQIIEGVNGIVSGQPLLYKAYNTANEKGMLLDGLSDIAVLPDGLVITASKLDDALQVFRIEDDQLSLKQTITHDGTTLLDGVQSITVSEDGSIIAAASVNSQAVEIFEHIAETDSITHFQTLLSTGANANGSYTISQIGDIALTNSGEVLVVSDRTTNNFIKFENSDSMMDFAGTYSIETNPELTEPRSIDFGVNDNLFATVSTGTNAMFTFRNFKNGEPVLHSSFDYSTYNFMGLSQVHTVKFIRSDRMITLAADTFCDYYIEEVMGFYNISQESRLKETTHIPVAFSPKDAAADSAGNSIYVVTSTGNGIVNFTRDPDTEEVAYDSFVSTDNISPDSCAVAADDQYLLTGSSAQDSLLLYKFAL
jgi:6-phosphogluconolactonase (cycloisomerase 2 family)